MSSPPTCDKNNTEDSPTTQPPPPQQSYQQQQLLEELSGHIDTLLHWCQHDPDLRLFALKFQVEHAAAKTAFDDGRSSDGGPRSPSMGSSSEHSFNQNGSPTSSHPPGQLPSAEEATSNDNDTTDAASPSSLGAGHGTRITLDDACSQQLPLEKRHLHHALRRVADFGNAVANHVFAAIIRVHSGDHRVGGSSDGMLNSPSSSCGDGKHNASSPNAASGAHHHGVSTDSTSSSSESNAQHAPFFAQGSASLRSNSVDDMAGGGTSFFEGSAQWIEQCAHLFYASIQCITLALIADPLIRPVIQQRLHRKGALVKLLHQALMVDKQIELTYFAEAYKTELMNLLANFCYNNTEVIGSVVEAPGFLDVVLSSTRIDEDNPGLVEWAEFVIRCLCMGSEKARTMIGSLKAQKIDPQSQEAVRASGNPDARLDLDLGTGKVGFHTVEM